MVKRNRASKKGGSGVRPDPLSIALARTKALGIQGCSGVDLRPSELMSTGLPLLDLATNGGLGFGRITHVWGASAAGKSALGLHLVAVFQRFYPDGLVIFADLERALSASFIGLLGVDTSRVVVVEPQTAEATMDCMEEILTDVREKYTAQQVPILVVWDSIASAASATELSGDYDSQRPGQFARAMSLGLKKLRPKIIETNALAVFLNQYRENISTGLSFGAETKKPAGGNAVIFYTDLAIRLSHVGKLAEKGCDPYGIKIEAQVLKSRQGPPLRRARFHFFYETGVITDLPDVYQALKKYNLAESIGGGKIAVKLPPKAGGKKWRRKEFPGALALAKELAADTTLYREVLATLQDQMYSATPESALALAFVGLANQGAKEITDS